MNPKYPVYIISKGRAETRLTSRYFEKMEMPYKIVVEPQEFDEYAAVIDPKKILTLPFSNLGLGGIPARNWVWEHAISTGADRHWIVDDNINGFYRYNYNLKIPVASGTIFKVMEDFVDRYTNIAMAGPQYFMFVPRKQVHPAYIINTRIYSCILIKNDLPHRWRGRYNEDTDLSLRFLKDGLCSILFNAFLQLKSQTMTMKGGNEQIYNESEGRKKFVESLIEQHPEHVKMVWRYDRWHHEVNYEPFKNNKLIFRPDYVQEEGINNYGMELKIIKKKSSEPEESPAEPEAPAPAPAAVAEEVKQPEPPRDPEVEKLKEELMQKYLTEKAEKDRKILFNDTMGRISRAWDSISPALPSCLKHSNPSLDEALTAAQEAVDLAWKSARLGMATEPEFRATLLDWERKNYQAIRSIDINKVRR